MQHTNKSNSFCLFFCFCFAFLFFSNICHSQTDSARYILTKRFLSVNDGLAAGNVLCGLQDSEGFIWLGTPNGLNRYDGKNFILFSKKTGLRSNTIVQLVLTSPDELWIFYGISGFSKMGGNMVDIMNPKTHELRSFKTKFPDCKLDEKDLFSLKPTGDGSFVLQTNHEYYTYKPAAHSFQKLDYGNGAGILDNFNFYHYNSAWLYNLNREHVFYHNGKREATIMDPATNFALIGMEADGSAIAAKVHEYSNKFYSIGADASLKPHTGIYYQAQKPFRPAASLFWLSYDAASNSSVMTGNMLCCFEKNQFYTLLDSAAMHALPDFLVYDYFIDTQGRKWVCTSIGLFIFSRTQNHFQSFFNDSSIIAVQKKFNQARGIFVNEQGDVYAGIGSSLCKANANGKTLQQFLPMAHFKDKLVHTDIVYGIAADTMIYAGLTNELMIIQPGYKQVETIRSDTLDEYWAIMQLSNNKLMIGARNGYLIFDKSSEKIIFSKRIYNVFLYKFTKDRDGNTWGASAQGLYRFDKNGNIQQHYTSSAAKKDEYIPYTDLLDLYIDKDGIFWMATNGDGLYRWDRSKNTFENFTRDNGLSSNMLYGILEDDFGNLWISSDFGLNRFNKSTHRNTIYTTANGINNNEFNRTSFFKAPDGKMFFGNVNGVNAFYPADFMRDSTQFNVPLRIVSFNQFSGAKDRLLDNTTELIRSNTITLQPGDKFFTLEFQLLDFEEGQHHYAYKLEGVDEGWNYISENSVRLSGLPYGNYTLHIKGQNYEGAWSKQELIIPVNILRPFYRTTWFLVLVLIISAGLIYFFLRWRTRNLELVNARLEETVGRRTEQLQDSLKQKDILLKEIHHRVKNNLQVISSLLELQASNTKDDALRSSLIEGQTRVRSIALIHHRLYEYENIGEIEFGGFLKDLYKQVASVFQKNDIPVEVLYDIPQTYFDTDTIVPLGLLTNELFTNSFKYAFDGTVKRKISLALAVIEKGNYRFTYIDNGPGLSADFVPAKATSLGLRLIYRLAKQLGGKVDYDKRSNSFTIYFMNSEARKQKE